MRGIVRAIKVALRWLCGAISLILLLAGLVALGFLGAVLVAGGGLSEKPLGQVWFQHDPFLPLTGSPSIQLVQVFFERKLNLPSLWDPGVLTLLNWPAPSALAVLAAGSLLLAFLFLALMRSLRR